MLAWRERERRQAQREAVLAYRTAWLTAKCLAGGSLPEVQEVYPVWNEEELRALQLAKYRARMERWAAKGS